MQPAQHVQRTRSAITALTEAFERCLGCVGEYQWLETVPGTVSGFWLDGDGHPRTDLDLTAEQYGAAIVALGTLRGAINDGSIGADLYRAKG